MAKKENNSLESKEKKDMIKAFDSPIMNKIAETFYLEAQARLEESKCRGIEIKEKEETQRKALEVQQEDNKFNYEYGKKALDIVSERKNNTYIRLNMILFPYRLRISYCE